MSRINKTYTPEGLKQAINALMQTGPTEADAIRTVIELHKLGWRVMYAGKLQGEPRQGTLTAQ